MRKGIRLIASLALVLGIACSSLGQAISGDEKQAVLDRMGEIIGSRAFVAGVDFKKWPDLLNKHKAEIDKTQSQPDFVAEVNRALEEFGFSHIVLATPAAAKARVDKKMVGLGIRISPEEKGIRVVGVFPNAPAIEAGVREGDLIILANGKKPSSPADFAGEEGTEIKITIEREGKTMDFMVKRRAYSTVMPETISWSTKDTAVIKIPSFDNGYNAENVDNLLKEASKAKFIVLDLRSNGGGAVTNLLHLAGPLLPEGADLGTFVTRDIAKKYAEATKKDPTDVTAIAAWTTARLRPFKPRVERIEAKIAVLINGGTGSASEMMAAALREHRGAQIIGTTSAGAVLASVMAQLPHGYMLQYPVFDYVTSKGYRIEGKGLKPDIEAMAAKYGDPDSGIAAATKWFKSKSDGTS